MEASLLLCLLCIIGHIRVNGDDSLQEYYRDQYEIIYRNYRTLYNTSIALYQDCTNKLEQYNQQYLMKHDINDVCMEKQFTNLTTEENLLKKNILLETANKQMDKTLKRYRNRLTTSNNHIRSYQENVTKLENRIEQMTFDILSIKIDNDKYKEKFQHCHLETLQRQNDRNKLMQDINNCVAMEKKCNEVKNMYSVDLRTCITTSNKFKQEQQQIVNL